MVLDSSDPNLKLIINKKAILDLSDILSKNIKGSKLRSKKTRFNNNALLVVSDYNIAVDLLEFGFTGLIPWGPHSMYGMFCKNNYKSILMMAQQKGRDPTKKPFVYTTKCDFVPNFLRSDKLSYQISDKARQIIYKIFLLSTKENVLGIFLRGNKKVLPSELMGRISDPFNNKSKDLIPTVGLMVSSSNNIHYNNIVSILSDNILIGTSSNLAGIGKGSGHHRVAPLIGDFAHCKKMFIFLGSDPQEGIGKSTSIVYLNENATNASIIREGSISVNELKIIFKKVGIKNIFIDPNIRKIAPYDYSLYPGGEVFMHTVYQTLVSISRENPIFEIPLEWAKKLKQPVPL